MRIVNNEAECCGIDCCEGTPDLVETVMRVSRQLQKEGSRQLSKHQLTPVQLQALQLLWLEDGIPMKRLAERLCCDVSNITHLVRRMERDGWMRRERDDEDGRSFRIHLTENGKILKTEYAGRACCGIDISALNNEEQSMLLALLQKLSDSLEE